MRVRGSDVYGAKRGNSPRSAGGGAYRRSIRAFSLVFIALGLILLATTLAHGGGPASVGVVMGVIFIAVGVGRLWVSSRVNR